MLVEQLSRSPARQTDQRGVHANVLGAGQIRVEPGTQLQKRRDPPIDPHLAVIRYGEPRRQTEQRALTGAIGADYRQPLAGLQTKAHVLQGVEAVSARVPRPIEKPLAQQGAAAVMAERFRYAFKLDRRHAHHR